MNFSNCLHNESTTWSLPCYAHSLAIHGLRLISGDSVVRQSRLSPMVGCYKLHKLFLFRIACHRAGNYQTKRGIHYDNSLNNGSLLYYRFTASGSSCLVGVRLTGLVGT